MQLEALSEHNDIELIVNTVGNAMLLHKGPLPCDYIWAQYDPSDQIMQFVTDEGDVHNLGMPIHPPFRDPLLKTREMALVEVKEDMSKGTPRFIKFTALVG